MTFLLANWKIIGAVALVVAILFGAYRHGVSTTADKYELQIIKTKESIDDQIQKAKNDKARIEAEQQAKLDKATVGYADSRQRLSDALKRLRDAQTMSGHCALPVAANSASGVPRTPADTTGVIDPVEAATGIRQTTFYAMSMQDTLQCKTLIDFLK